MGKRSIVLAEAVGEGLAVHWDGEKPGSAGLGVAGISFVSGAIGDTITLTTGGEASVYAIANNAMDAGAFLVAQTDGTLSGSNEGADLTDGIAVLGRAEHDVAAGGDPVRFTYDTVIVTVP